jgi:hypothetical protein
VLAGAPHTLLLAPASAGHEHAAHQHALTRSNSSQDIHTAAACAGQNTPAAAAAACVVCCQHCACGHGTHAPRHTLPAHPRPRARPSPGCAGHNGRWSRGGTVLGHGHTSRRPASSSTRTGLVSDSSSQRAHPARSSSACVIHTHTHTHTPVQLSREGWQLCMM